MRHLRAPHALPTLDDPVTVLAAQGYSNRQIAKVLGVDRRTVDRDVSGANAPSSGANAPPESSEEDELKKAHASRSLGLGPCVHPKTLSTIDLGGCSVPARQ